MKYFILLFLIQLPLYSFGQNEYIILGSGGGFSGQTMQYKILKDGTVFKGTGIAEIKFENRSKIRKSEAKKIFKNLSSVISQSFSYPGNMSYFIYLITPDSEIKCTWGDNEFIVPENLKKAYTETTQKLSKLEYNPVDK